MMVTMYESKNYLIERLESTWFYLRCNTCKSSYNDKMRSFERMSCCHKRSVPKKMFRVYLMLEYLREL